MYYINFKKIIITLGLLIWVTHSCFATNIQHSSHITPVKKHKAVKIKTIKPATHKTIKKVKHASPHKNKKKSRTKLAKKTFKKTSKQHNKSKKNLKKHSVHKATPIKNQHSSVNIPQITSTQTPAYSLNAIEKSLVSFVRKTVSGISYTAYKFGGTRIDSSNGIYVVDCSRYVDHILKTIYPQAYTSLTSWSGTSKPTTNDFYHYFTNLSNEDTQHWNTVDDVEQLRPGDILVFRNKAKTNHRTSGHVMVVMDPPTRSGNTFSVRIADSAPSGHTKDTRSASGIGIGTMLLKVHPHTFRPYAYAWKIGARWETNVNFAMARPIDFS